jgi:glycolate oxidase FAD binding subunit
MQPATIQDLQRSLASASAGRKPVASVDLSALNRILEYRPEDMTVTVEAGITLTKLQETLNERGQWLPIDPPFPERTTIGELLARNLSGPRRFGYGTIREYLIGLSVVLADGRLVKSGGKVVKNVAGYDLLKLFVGDHGSLGVIVEATFKVLPSPACERILRTICTSMNEACAFAQRILQSQLAPVVLDLHYDGTSHGKSAAVIAFSGASEEVQWQAQQAGEMTLFETCDLAYHRQFWSRNPAPYKLSVLPSKLLHVFGEYLTRDFVAHAGNGVIYYRGEKEPPKARVPLALTRRLKETFDPNHILPELPL